MTAALRQCPSPSPPPFPAYPDQSAMPDQIPPKLRVVEPPPEDTSPRWFILRVISQRERMTAEALREKGVDAFVPKHVRPPLHAHRKAVRTGPLFPGYVFVSLPDDDSLDIARNFRNVIEIMCWDGRPRRLPNLAIGSLVFLEACHAFDETWEPPKIKGRRYSYRWKAGDRVRINSGAFEGFLADVQRGHGKDRMQVLLSIFGRPTEIILEHRQMEKPDDDAKG